MAELPAHVVAAAQADADALHKEYMALHELRQAYALSQERLAALLGVQQAAISKVEKRTDIYISTLRSYIQALGGELDIVARFPNREIHISQFHDIPAMADGPPPAPKKVRRRA